MALARFIGMGSATKATGGDIDDVATAETEVVQLAVGIGVELLADPTLLTALHQEGAHILTE